VQTRPKGSIGADPPNTRIRLAVMSIQPPAGGINLIRRAD
jgi:hypothetical protein